MSLMVDYTKDTNLRKCYMLSAPSIYALLRMAGQPALL